MSQNIKGKLVSFVFNVLLGIVGFVLLTNPSFGITFIRVYLGLILIGVSIVPFFMFFVGTDEKSGYDFVKGVLLVFAGLVFLFVNNAADIVFGFALLVWMTTSGIMKIALAFEYKKYAEKYWWVMAVIGVIALGFAVYVLFNLSSALSILIAIGGLFMLAESITGIIRMILPEKNHDQQAK